jgi:metallophosphoesterase (TIGR00282 family)
MNILYIGDIMGEAGLEIVERLLPGLKKEFSLDLVIAQAENTTAGKGISLNDFERLRQAGVDFCSGGNHSLFLKEINEAMSDPAVPIIRPANYPSKTPGLGYKYVDTKDGSVLIVSLLGQIVGRDADKPVDNPLQTIDKILKSEKSNKKAAIIVNFHGDFSSEKFVIGHYLDGKVSAVIGDHWHTPTADADVLPGGTAHITDVGMCGSLDSSLGVKYSDIIPRWRNGTQTRNQLEKTGRMQFNALLVEIDTSSGKAVRAEHIREIIPSSK